ncbi:MAG TPA: helix-turn-helix transcriptional regulator [Solirubrobacteraceae bacterium]|jgi:PadR family transcriptional regulator AphA|nr:helix-turn-helix transcriptional regulator [Solirubrobacteraceae bacterium]
MKSKQIRLTSTSYAVMSLLELLGEATPYDLKRALEQSIENFWHVPHTTIYTEPTRLAAGGFLSEQQESGGRRRKLYALTDSGREALRAWADAPESEPPELRDEGMLKIFAGADPHTIFTNRRDWHQAKLTELEGLLESLRGAEGSIAHELDWTAEQRQSAEATVRFGTAYHRLLLELVESFRAGGPAGS